MLTAGTEEMGRQDGQLPTQVLSDQLTLSQPDGADYDHHITNHSPPPPPHLIFRPSYALLFLLLFERDT